MSKDVLYNTGETSTDNTIVPVTSQELCFLAQDMPNIKAASILAWVGGEGAH